MRLSREDRSIVSEWWFTVDRLMLSALFLLMVGGLLVSLAASPPIAIKHGLEPFYFVKRHALFFVPAILLLLAFSLLTPTQMRRLSLIVFLVAIGLMILVLLVGVEVKGAKRWLTIASYSLQPSEFAKPAFVVLIAWFFSESHARTDMPGNQFAIAFYAVFVGLLLVQPDFGQALLITCVWGGLFFLAGLSLRWVIGLGLVGVGGLVLAYKTFPHVADRINRFLDPSTGDTYQTDRALQSFIEGGWFGVGPGEGKLKNVLPDAHADFIFAVVAEEFGIIACTLLLGLFALIVLRGLTHAMREPDDFIRYAASGLVMLFGLQAAINMAVNVGLLPAKGMTLPFISYGGSSLIATSMTMGMALGLTRKRATPARLGPQIIASPSAEGPVASRSMRI